MHKLSTRRISAIFGGLVMGSLFYPVLIYGATTETIFSITGNADSGYWGRTGATYVQSYAQKYQSGATDLLCGVRHKIARNGSPSDTVVFTVYQGGSNPQNGLAMVSSTVSGATLPTNTATETDFNFGGYCITLVSGQTYWFTLTRSGALSDTDNYISRIQTTGGNEWAYVVVNGGWFDNSPQALAITAYGVANLSYYSLPTSTVSSTAWTLTCDESAGTFSYSICNLFVGLFIPNPSVFDAFTGLYDQIENKPPIGYLTAISDALGGVGTSTAPYSISAVSAFSGFFSPIRTALSWILWLVFAFWIINRLRHLQL
jgi:hypothetical protein